jgi:hypothetical protein
MKYLFYVTAISAASVNLLGPTGLVAATLIASAWWYVYFASRYTSAKQRLLEVLCAVLLISTLLCLIPVPLGFKMGFRNHCSHHISRIVLALENYHNRYRSYPPAVTYDATGKPMHSWRVLILPWLGERSLYESYSMDEPWNGPNNTRLLERIPSIFQCPESKSRSTTNTNFFVVIGDNTLFPPQATRSANEVTDGLSQTIAVVELARGIPWTEPADPTLEEFLPQVLNLVNGKNAPHYHHDLLEHHYSGVQVGMADYEVQQGPYGNDTEWLWLKLLQINDGKLTPEERIAYQQQRYSSLSRPRIEGYVALLAFIALTLLPICWIGRAPKRDTT